MEVRGKALRLYWLLDRPGGASIDELAMSRSFKKKRSELDRALATLRRVGLIRRDEDGRYYVPPEIAPTASFLLKAFRPMGRYVVPYSLISAVLFTVFFFASLLFAEPAGRDLVVIMGAVIASLFWAWAAYTWAKRPFRGGASSRSPP